MATIAAGSTGGYVVGPRGYVTVTTAPGATGTVTETYNGTTKTTSFGPSALYAKPFGNRGYDDSIVVSVTALSADISANGLSDTAPKEYPSTLSLPPASDFGVGVAQVGVNLYASDGNSIVSLNNWFVPGKVKAVVQGNSIVAAMQWVTATGVYTDRSEHMYADQLLGGVFRYPLITPVTAAKSDKYGCYGYSGQTLAAIIADLPLEHFAPLANVGFIPDVVLGLALLENDVPTRTYAQMKDDVEAWISINRAQWPGVKLVIGCPRPSKFYATTASRNNWAAIKAYLKSLNDGVNIAVYEPGLDYADSVIPSLPQSWSVLATVDGTANTVTLDATETRRLYPGQLIVDSNHAVTNCNLSTRTYTITNIGAGNLSNVLTPTLLPVFPYHDDGPHPQGYATGLNAHRLATAVKALFPAVAPGMFAVGTNKELLGSSAVVGGTVPTGLSIEAAFSTFTFAYEALNPGVRQTISTIPANTNRQGCAYIQLCDDSTTIPKGTNRFQAMMVAVIESGAEYVKYIRLQYAFRDNGVLGSFVSTMADSTSSQFPHAENAEDIVITTPMIYSAGVGTFIDRIQLRASIVVIDNCPADAVVVWRIKRYAVLCPDGITGRVALTAGTATIAAGAYVKANSKIQLTRITPGGTIGAIDVTAKTAGTSFVITSANAGDTSIVEYTIS